MNFNGFYEVFTQESPELTKFGKVWKIDLKFSGSISVVHIDVFVMFSMPRSRISKNRLFQDFGL